MVLNRDDSDAAARAQAQESHDEGVRIITSHLSSHLDQNPGSDFVSWIATLHPENADVRIDPRFFVPNNPWWSVYEAAKPAASTVVVDGVPVDSITREEVENGRQDSKSNDSPGGGCFCNPVGFVVGIALAFSSIVSTFSIEVAALPLYFLAAVSFHVATPCNPPANPLTGIIFSVFMLLYWIFSMVDSILLLVSVLVSEILGAVAGILGCLCGGFRGAKEWHQTVRKASHSVRATFRRPFTSPSRQLLCSAGVSAAEDNGHGSSGGSPSPGNTATRVNSKPTIVSIPQHDNDTPCCPEESPTEPTVAVLVDTLGGGTPPTNPDYQPPPAYKYTN